MDNPSKYMVIIRPPLTKILSLVTLMVAMNLASNYVMIGIPNIKIMDLLVFISGYLMGALPGIMVGVLTWVVYGTINPYGFHPVIFVATCLGEGFYGFIGWFSRRVGSGSDIFLASISKRQLLWLNFKFGVIGFLATFVYDLFTNIVSAVIFGLPPIMGVITGAYFSIVHEVSNFFFFFFGCSIIVKVIKKLIYVGGEEK
ncbi:MAG: hypothetical protein QXI48_07220 [Candidatus Bathyarchaeia archaeon]